MRPLDLLLEVNSGRGGNDQTLGFMHRAANRLNRLVVLVIQGIDNAKNRAQFADDLLIAWTYLAEGQVFLTRVRLAMVPRDIGYKIQVQFVE